MFHTDSYGYRPGKSAIDAVRQARQRCWRYDGAVLYTGSTAAMRGLNVVVPVDGMSSEDPFYELATAWLLANGTGGIGPRVTLTKVDMIKF